MDFNFKPITKELMRRKFSFVEKVFMERGGDKSPVPAVLVIDNVRSKYNVGSMMRSCDGVGIEEMVVCGISPKGNEKEVRKTALKAVETVKVRYEKNVVEVINSYKLKGFFVYVVEIGAGSLNYKEVKFQFPCVLVMGNELEGINSKLIKNADEVIEIPMMGKVKSLNVATAFAVVAYEMRYYFDKNKMK